MNVVARAALAATLLLAAGWVSACSGTDTSGSGGGSGELPGTPGPSSSSGSSGASSSSSSSSSSSGGGTSSGGHVGDGGTTPPSGDASTNPPTGDSGTTPPGQDAAPPSDGFDAFQHHNLDTVNSYRAKLGVAPLVLDTKLCTFASAGSTELSQDHSPHQHFINAGNDGSLWTSGFSHSAAENQGDPNGWYVMSQDPTQNELSQIDSIQKAMYDEGPGAGEAHGHYTNMMNATYKRLGVGLLEVQGKLYLTNDFSD